MITNEKYISQFISRSFEKSVDNCLLLDKNYVIPKNKLNNYINKVLDIPYIEYIHYIEKNTGVVEENQLTQSSKFTACTSEMCEAIINKGNPGMKFVDIGQLFSHYIKQNNDMAFRKYGENQVKTSMQLGLTFEYYDFWYLTCVGYIYNELDKNCQKSLLARTLLRIPLYQNLLLQLLKRDVFLAEFMKNLAPSTQGRRAGSIIRLLKLC